MVHFLFFRHGETDWNLGKRFQGHTDIPLNETGRAQARTLAEKVRFWQPEMILSSDLIRAYETAQLGNLHWNVPILKSAQLREMHLGKAEGLHREKVQDLVGEKFNEFISSDLQFENFRFPEGESKKEAKTRVLSFLESFVAQNPDKKRIAVSTHGGILKRVTSSFPETGPDGVPIPNCVTYRLDYDPTKRQWFFVVPRERSSVLIEDQGHFLLREAQEEAGATLECFAEDHIYQEYDFHWTGKKFWSRTYFYRAKLSALEKTSRSPEESYLGEQKWLKALELVNHYKDFPAIQYAIQKLTKL